MYLPFHMAYRLYSGNSVANLQLAPFSGNGPEMTNIQEIQPAPLCIYILFQYEMDSRPRLLAAPKCSASNYNI